MPVKFDRYLPVSWYIDEAELDGIRVFVLLLLVAMGSAIAELVEIGVFVL